MVQRVKKILLEGIHEFLIIGCSSGGMGKVYFLQPLEKPSVYHTPMGRTIHPFQGGIAAKFPKNAEDSLTFERECKIWLNLKHRHIVPLLRVIEVGGVMAAIMPLYHESLRDLMLKIKNINEIFWLKQLICIFEALNYAWQYHKLLHLDLKPENILNYYEERSPYLSIADWGMARFIDYSYSHLHSMNKQGCPAIESLDVYGGTLPYMSPDRMRSALFGSKYCHSIADDIYSMGIIISEILLDYNPCFYGTKTQKEVVERVLTGQYYNCIMQIEREYNNSLVSLAQICTNPEQKMRPKSYNQIINYIKSHVV